MRWWKGLNRLRWPARWPVKMTVVAATVAGVCFPYPWQLAVHLSRWRNPNALIDPDAASLAPWLEELRSGGNGPQTPQAMLARVERYVYQHLPYAFDWENWGNADYIPTVEEALAAGREDCDGRAVVAASLLKGLGYKAKIVTDFAHVWVATDYGETMNPGAAQAVVAEEGGLAVQPSALAQLPRALGYGISPFFLHRELMVVGVLWLMWVRPGVGKVRAAAAMALMVAGLLLLRRGGHHWQAPVVWMQVCGLSAYAAAAVILRQRRSPAATTDQPLSPAVAG